MCNSRIQLSKSSTAALPPTLRRRSHRQPAGSDKYHSSKKRSFIPQFELRQKVRSTNGSEISARTAADEQKRKSHGSFAGVSDCNLYDKHSFLHDAAGSLDVEDVVAIIRNGVRQYHCLRKAFLAYLFAVYFNIITLTDESDARNSTYWNFLSNFLRFYPTFVGWLFLAIKMKRIVFHQEEIMTITPHYPNPSKGRPHWSTHRRNDVANKSTDTCDTFSSYLSTIDEDTELEVELKEEDAQVLNAREGSTEQSNPDTSNKKATALPPHQLSPSAIGGKHQDSCSSWGYFADVASSSTIGEGVEASAKMELQCQNEVAVQDEDWGFFADPDEEPRPQTKRQMVKQSEKSDQYPSMPINNYNALTKYIGEGLRFFSH